MESRNKIARFSGMLLVIVFLTSAVAAGLAGSVGDYNISPEEIGSLLVLIAEHKELHMAEIGFDYFSYIITVILATTLYLKLKGPKPLRVHWDVRLHSSMK